MIAASDGRLTAYFPAANEFASPRRFRIIGPLRNLDAWYTAFGIGPESKFYIAPEKRVRIW